MKMNTRSCFFAFIALAFLISCRKDPALNNSRVFSATPFPVSVPKYFPPLNNPIDNPLTVEGVKLGKMLFYDPILSSDSSKSCFSCHAQAYSFTDHGTKFSTGVTGLLGNKNAPALINLGFRL